MPAVCAVARNSAPDATGAGAEPTPQPRIGQLTKRAEFLAANRGRRLVMPGFVLLAHRRDDAGEFPSARYGITCSKKVGNAVARNRAKRRLRAIAQAGLPQHGRPGWDYVLIGRPQVTAERPYSLMLSDLETAVSRVHEA